MAIVVFEYIDDKQFQIWEHYICCSKLILNYDGNNEAKVFAQTVDCEG